MLTLYMYFNGTGIWGGETMCMEGIDSFVSIPFSELFFKKDSMCLIMVCHIGVWLGTKVVKSALRMFALYMYFNGTGIWGGETTWDTLRK